MAHSDAKAATFSSITRTKETNWRLVCGNTYTWVNMAHSDAKAATFSSMTRTNETNCRLVCGNNPVIPLVNDRMKVITNTFSMFIIWSVLGSITEIRIRKRHGKTCLEQPLNNWQNKDLNDDKWASESDFQQCCISDRHTRSLIRAFACRFNILCVLSYWLNTIWSF